MAAGAGLCLIRPLQVLALVWGEGFYLRVGGGPQEVTLKASLSLHRSKQTNYSSASTCGAGTTAAAGTPRPGLMGNLHTQGSHYTNGYICTATYIQQRHKHILKGPYKDRRTAASQTPSHWCNTSNTGLMFWPGSGERHTSPGLYVCVNGLGPDHSWWMTSVISVEWWRSSTWFFVQLSWVQFTFRNTEGFGLNIFFSIIILVQSNCNWD